MITQTKIYEMKYYLTNLFYNHIVRVKHQPIIQCIVYLWHSPIWLTYLFN